MLIRSLQSAVEREQALSKFSRRWMSGKLLGVADIYIPYRLYKMTLEDRRVRTARLLAIDAISGNLDPFEFSESPLQTRCTDMETRNIFRRNYLSLKLMRQRWPSSADYCFLLGSFGWPSP